MSRSRGRGRGMGKKTKAMKVPRGRSYQPNPPKEKDILNFLFDAAIKKRVEEIFLDVLRGSYDKMEERMMVAMGEIEGLFAAIGRKVFKAAGQPPAEDSFPSETCSETCPVCGDPEFQCHHDEDCHHDEAQPLVGENLPLQGGTEE